MRRYTLAVAGMFLMAACHAVLAASVTGLEAYRGETRVLVIQVRRFDQVALARQKHILRADEVGIAQRGLVVFAATRDAVLGIIGEAPAQPPRIRTDGAATGRGFHAVLVGMDGTVKAQWDRPVSLEALFAAADKDR
ncbi:MAG: DUF4174 domain-containing protein [Rhodobiaceae bacterium]|nr:DUF4174 domain-containing protein [Rhodobiaceae bacterium]